MGILFVLLAIVFLICNVNSHLIINNNTFHSFLYSHWITCDHDKDSLLDVSKIDVYFYDFQNNLNISSKISNAVEKIASGHSLDVSKKLIFFVPGYRSHINKMSPELMRQTFRDVPNIYLIIVDNAMYTMPTRGRWKSYENSVKYTYSIGQALGKFLSDLHYHTGLPSRNIHCIGHSLGGQILGVIGTTYFNRTFERIGRLTGLDPAGPCFANSFNKDQIRSGCADYVEVYHCNAGDLGTDSVLADIDFFFNKDGRIQPSCDVESIPGIEQTKEADCSHTLCMNFWTNTVHNPNLYLARKCDSYKHFAKGKCSGNEVTIAGYSNPGIAYGTFYVSTDGIF